jgi:endonuclease YncB( thermonuclease family)
MFLSATPPPPAFSATVTKIVDGDTFYGVTPGNSQEIKVRFACGDAPELSQPGGKSARMSLLGLLPPGTVVEIRPVGPNDRYGRTPAFVFSGTENINLQQTLAGQMWFYSEYSRTCPEYAPVLKAAEVEARFNRLGLWDQLDPCRPADWRSNKCVERPDCNPVESQ